MNILVWLSSPAYRAHRRRIRVSSSLILPRYTGRMVLGCLLAALVAALLAMGLGADAAHAEAAGSSCTIYVTVEAGSTLNGRTEPSKQGEICARFGRGDALDVVSYQEGWYSVLGSEYGHCWVSADYVSSEAPTDEPSSGVIASSGRVALRDKPDGKRVAWLHNGDCVTVASVVLVDGTRWARVDGGYVDADYVALDAQKEADADTPTP